MSQTTVQNTPLDRNGIIVIDKPSGCSSAKAVAELKKVSWVHKTGHTGTLDPFATGVMICGINKGTRLSQFFLNGNKTYRAELILGLETDTQDYTGKPVSEKSENLDHISNELIEATIKAFEGPQKQLPPSYSALKHNGVPLYKLARKGKAIQKPARNITIYSITILSINSPSVWFEVSCSSGTYIRTLCSDIGKKLGCGGHLKTLRRTESCGFTLESATPLSQINDLEKQGTLTDKVISLSQALKEMPEYIADKEMTEKIIHGQALNKKDYTLPFSATKKEFIKIINKSDRLLAILTDSEENGNYKYCCVFN